MTYPAHIRAVLVLGLPLVGGHLAQFAIHLTDTVMMGWHSVAGLAALTLATAIWFTLWIMGAGIAWAVMPLVASADAEADETAVRRVTRMGLWLSVLFALASLPLFWFSAPLLRLMGQAPELSAEAQDYLRIAGPGILPALLVMVLKSYLAALGRTQVVLWITVAAAVANAAFNYALIFGNWGAPELGLRGAAVASVSTNALSLVFSAAYAVAVLPEHRLFARLWRPDWEVFRQVARMGAAIGITNLAEVALFSFSSVMMGWLGTIPLAAHGIALQISSATFMVHVGLSNAATIRAGNAYGLRDAEHLARGARAALALSGIAVALTVVLFLTAPGPLYALFLDPAEPARAEIMALGALLLAIAALFQLVDAAQVMALGLLRGVRDTTVPMIMAAVSYWGVGIPAALVLGFVLDWGGAGVWLGLTLGLACAGVLMTARFWGRSVPRLRAGEAPAAPQT
ncbi:MATE family efflux transporter [Rhodosalinus halophilus]|uniref:Multidrug-efflux transporter n=1 Tax=Rhodosalinus halophilus TaxID=2259333 RepID=A0A365UDM9_9RHOB|nr:MATE family efflux transporter [Rhodosalinus halophilus]RBI86815.1 MATE family efflux transporter [Rhodosalinus halophilus]